MRRNIAAQSISEIVDNAVFKSHNKVKIAYAEIAVDGERAPAARRESESEICGDGRFSDAALERRDGYDFAALFAWGVRHIVLLRETFGFLLVLNSVEIYSNCLCEAVRRLCQT